MQVSVECLSSSTYPDRPVALIWQGERLGIEAILARWRTPEGSFFQVRTAGAQLFRLFYSEIDDFWLAQGE